MKQQVGNTSFTKKEKRNNWAWISFLASRNRSTKKKLHYKKNLYSYFFFINIMLLGNFTQIKKKRNIYRVFQKN